MGAEGACKKFMKHRRSRVAIGQAICYRWEGGGGER